MDDQLYEEGLASRRRVHGDAFVDRALEVKDPGHADFQRFVTEYCWGAAWSQDGASLHERSLLALGVFAARNQYDDPSALPWALAQWLQFEEPTLLSEADQRLLRRNGRHVLSPNHARSYSGK